jgi:hypothetical protein
VLAHTGGGIERESVCVCVPVCVRVSEGESKGTGAGHSGRKKKCIRMGREKAPCECERINAAVRVRGPAATIGPKVSDRSWLLHPLAGG